MPKACDLKTARCVPCEGGVPPLTAAELADYLPQVPRWTLEGQTIHRELETADFVTALSLVNRIGALAEQHGHHPNLYLHDYRKLRIELTTHAIGGLSTNDFILAAQIDAEVGG
jgi:4a-hydroxytetrahydrobiopterin dehydratase